MKEIEIPINTKVSSEISSKKPKKESAEDVMISDRDVIIRGIDIPFFDMVEFLVKLTFSTIPAAIIVAIIWSLIGGLFVSFVSFVSSIFK